MKKLVLISVAAAALLFVGCKGKTTEANATEAVTETNVTETNTTETVDSNVTAQ